jgi:hypothetical protein
MKILERNIKHILPGKQSEREALAKEVHIVESKYDFPPLKRFILFSGAGTLGTEVMERQWPSLAAMETALEKAISDPEWQALNKELTAMSQGDAQVELYWVADWA